MAEGADLRAGAPGAVPDRGMYPQVNINLCVLVGDRLHHAQVRAPSRLAQHRILGAQKGRHFPFHGALHGAVREEGRRHIEIIAAALQNRDLRFDDGRMTAKA